MGNRHRTRNFEKRLRALEARFHSEPIIVYLADGSVHQICGREDYLQDLFAGFLGGAPLTPEQCADLELIHQSISLEEPGGGHMVELLCALMNSPVEE